VLPTIADQDSRGYKPSENVLLQETVLASLATQGTTSTHFVT